MKIQGQVGLLLGLGMAVLVGLGSWQYAQLMTRQSDGLSLENLRIEVASSRRLIEKEITNLGDELARLVALRESLTPSEGSGQEAGARLGAFELLALLDFNQSSQRWQPRWTLQAEVSQRASFSESATGQILDSLPIARVSGPNTVWYRVEDASGRVFLALLVQVQAAPEQVYVGVGLLPLGVFSDSLASFKMSSREAILLDERGYAIGYTASSYVGARLDGHPVVAEILGRRELRGEGQFLNLKGEPVLAAFERMEKSNLYLALVAPQAALAPFISEFALSFALWAAVGLLIFWFGVGALFSMSVGTVSSQRQGLVEPGTDQESLLTSGNQGEEGSIRDLSDGSGDLQPPQMESEIDSKPLEVERMRTFQQIGFGLSQALSGPIAAILGHAQLARSKAKDDQLKSHFVVIEREARRARDTIDNLGRLTSAEEVEQRRVDIQDVVLKALASLRHEISRQGIKVAKDLSQTVAVMGHAGQLQTAIEELLKNAIQALSGSVTKEIRVSLRVEKGEVELLIEDTGKGMSPEELAHAFDAFYTTKDPEENAGLGLGVAKGLLKNMNGQIELHSVPGQGTKVLTRMKAVGKIQMTANAQESLPKEVPVPVPTPEVALTLGEGASPHRGSVALKGAEDLLKAKVIVGTKEDELPAPPQLDEKTFLGDVQEVESLEDELTSAKEPDLDFVVRPPKVRSGG